MTSKYANNKKTIYIKEEILKEIEAEAKRQDRTVSWIIKRAWLESKEKIKNYPGINL